MRTNFNKISVVPNQSAVKQDLNPNRDRRDLDPNRDGSDLNSFNQNKN